MVPALLRLLRLAARGRLLRLLLLDHGVVLALGLSQRLLDLGVVRREVARLPQQPHRLHHVARPERLVASAQRLCGRLAVRDGAARGVRRLLGGRLLGSGFGGGLLFGCAFGSCRLLRGSLGFGRRLGLSHRLSLFLSGQPRLLLPVDALAPKVTDLLQSPSCGEALVLESDLQRGGAVGALHLDFYALGLEPLTELSRTTHCSPVHRCVAFGGGPCLEHTWLVIYQALGLLHVGLLACLEKGLPRGVVRHYLRASRRAMRLASMGASRSDRSMRRSFACRSVGA